VGVALLDSTTVVGLLDADDPLHDQADAAVRSAATEHLLAVSVVTVAEVLTGAKLGHHDEQTVGRFLDQAIARRIVVDEAVAERAAELRAARRALRMPDALILATGDLHAQLVLTADRTWLTTPGLSCEVSCLSPAD
jgi:predicted nucleic acid-binding protein